MLDEKYMYPAAYKYCVDNGYKPTSYDFMITQSDGKGIKIIEWKAPGVAEPTLKTILDYIEEAEAITQETQMKKEFFINRNSNDKYFQLIKALASSTGIQDVDQWIMDNV